MLCLTKQIHGDPVRICLTVAQHQYLRGAGYHINGDLTKYRTLGCCHKDIAWANNFIDFGDRFCAIR